MIKTLSGVSLALSLSACGIDRSQRDDKRALPEVSAQGTENDVSGLRIDGGAQFILDEVHVQNVVQTKTSKNGFPEEKQYLFKVCVKDRISLSGVSDRAFVLRTETETKNLRTDIVGCLRWTETHSYRHSDSETYFELGRSIEGASIYSGTQKLTLFLNPWKGSVDDSRFSSPPESFVKTQSGLKSNLSESTKQNFENGTSKKSGQGALDVKAVQFQVISFDKSLMTLSSDLRLQTVHNYELKFTVSSLRKIIGGFVSENPSSGQVRIRAFFVKNPMNSDTQSIDLSVIAFLDQEMSIGVNGLVSQAVQVQILDPIAMSGRFYMFAQIEDLSSPMGLGLAPGTFSAIVENLSPFPIGIKPVNFNLTPQFEVWKKNLSEQKKMDSLTQLLARTKFTPSTSASDANSQRLLEGLKVATEQSQLEALSRGTWACSALRGEDEKSKQAFERCLCEAKGSLGRFFGSCSETIIKSYVRDVVVGETSTPEILSGPVALTLTVNAKMEKSSTSSASKGRKICWTCVGANFSASADIGVSAKKATEAVKEMTNEMIDFGAKAGVGLSFKSSVDWYSITAVDETSSQGSSVGLSSSISYGAEAYKLSFKTLVKRCLMIQVGGEIQVEKILCTEPFERQVVEHQFFVNMNLGRDSAITDADSQDSKFRFVVRGQDSFMAIKTLLEKQNIVLYYSKRADSVKGTSDLQGFSGVTEEFPGLLKPTEN